MNQNMENHETMEIMMTLMDEQIPVKLQMAGTDPVKQLMKRPFEILFEEMALELQMKSEMMVINQIIKDVNQIDQDHQTDGYDQEVVLIIRIIEAKYEETAILHQENNEMMEELTLTMDAIVLEIQKQVGIEQIMVHPQLLLDLLNEEMD